MAVYASSNHQERGSFWDKIQHFWATVQVPWLLMGDFNDTINLEERNHGGIEMIT